MPSANPNSDTPNVDLLGMDGIAQARNMYHFHRSKNDETIKRRINPHKLHSHRALLPNLLNYYLQQLSETNEATFRFLTMEQREALANRLVYTLNLLNMQYQLDKMEGRRYRLGELKDGMRRCNDLLDQLSVRVDKDTPGSLLLEDTVASDKALKFTAMRDFSPSFVQTMLSLFGSTYNEFSEHITGKVIENMSELNGVRLYWVWGGSMLGSLLTVLQGTGINTVEANRRLSMPSSTTGYMSWVLYYARFGIQLGLLLKHCIKGPWMSKEEAQIPFAERFKTQWQQRKFALLNDLIWATANLAGFFWLVGPGLLGYSGNVLTAALLLMDLGLSCLRYWEESTAHNKKMLEIGQAFEAIKAELAKLRAAAVPDLEKIAALEQQRKDLVKLHEHTEFEWKHRRRAMENDIFYAGALLIAFALTCCFFFPPVMIPAATAAAIGLAGAALCFVLTVAYSAINGGLEIAKSRELSRRASSEGQELLDEFNNSTDLNTRKRLYLQMQALSAKSVYHQQMARFQAFNLVRSVLIDALIPALVFSSIALMPLGAGFGVLGAALVLIIISKIIMKQFEPGMPELPEMNEADELAFEEFNENPPERFPVKKSEHRGFFQEKTPPEYDGISESTPLLEKSPEDSDDYSSSGYDEWARL
ncbi:hypothetical protein [Legionella sp. CNM-4043-24]|uniref:hypothetical protein n=1 Tax=Legionella sp. CNM-4043-24 TaxID=3421646 RepID=UPI00403ABDB7